LDEAGFMALDTRTAELAEAAADFAEQGPEPAPGALYEDILVEE
jgi:TPP-dependent pyruvate/acetoin dehydrogenase alpha subunit